MKKKVALGLLTATVLSSLPLNTYAVGSASVNFRSNDTVFLGDNIKVYMSLENIEDANNGIVGVGGKLNFDSEKLELIEAKTVDTPYDFWFNPKSNKLAGLDFTFEKAINKDTKIYEFTFKAIDTGSTSVSLDQAELSDSKTNVLNTNVYGKNITITEKVEEVKVEEPKNIHNEIKTNEKPVVKEETNKERLVKVNEAVHGLLKKISELF